MNSEISPEYYAYYDLIYANRTVDLNMWQRFATEAEGPILDVGCGTGRVLRFLAPMGYALTGIDISAEAVRQAQDKVWGAHVSIVQADMCDFDLADKDFALALMVHNTFLHCLSREAQLSCLRAIHRHLQRAGRLVVDVSVPPTDNTQGQFHLGREFVDAEGCSVQWFLNYTMRFAEQTMDCIQILDKIDHAGVVHRAVIRFPQRCVYRNEVEILLTMAGFELESIYGDYELRPLDEHSQKMIFVAKRTDKLSTQE